MVYFITTIYLLRSDSVHSTVLGSEKGDCHLGAHSVGKKAQMNIKNDSWIKGRLEQGYKEEV